MNIKELNGWIGEWDIIIKHKDGTTEKEHVKNRITNASLNMLRDALSGDVSDCEIKYLALGGSDKAVDDNDTTLDDEQFRTAEISRTKPETGRLQHTYIVIDDEAVFHIKEIGVFAGSTATETENTGTMISRILWDRNKTNLESIQFVRTDTIDRG